MEHPLGVLGLYWRRMGRVSKDLYDYIIYLFIIYLYWFMAYIPGQECLFFLYLLQNRQALGGNGLWILVWARFLNLSRSTAHLVVNGHRSLWVSVTLGNTRALPTLWPRLGLMKFGKKNLGPVK